VVPAVAWAGGGLRVDVEQAVVVGSSDSVSPRSTGVGGRGGATGVVGGRAAIGGAGLWLRRGKVGSGIAIGSVLTVIGVTGSPARGTTTVCVRAVTTACAAWVADARARATAALMSPARRWAAAAARGCCWAA
jgi:hypothetical protein